MIVSAEFKNFRALRDVKIDLEPFTVIVGPNSCGKSTLLEGLSWFYEKLPGKFVELYNCRSKGSSGFIAIGGRIENSDNITTSYFLNSEGVISINGSNYSFENSLTLRIRNAFGLYIKLHPNGASMSKPSYGSIPTPTLDSDGRGLATICANLQLEHPKIFEKVQSEIKKVIPSIKRFRIKRSKTTNYIGEDHITGPEAIGEELVFDFENVPEVSANQVSEGTLITLCILVAAARADNEPFLVLLDDLERGLHPKATRDLINVLRDLQKENPNLQIIATTHSPYLLDHFEPREVRVAALDPVRGTVIARLDESPDFEKWHEVLNTGELWSHVGEKWVLEKNILKDDNKESV